MMKKINNYAAIFFAATFLNFYKAFGSDVNIPPRLIEKSKKSVVTIEVSSSLKAYGYFSTASSGTGFLVNKAKGIILTNRHIANPITISNFQLTFYNGQKAQAKLLYADPWLDFAFLQVDPSIIPKDTNELNFSKNSPKMGETVMIIGNNEGKNFSIQTGKISDLYVIEGNMPQHSICISLNTKGGSSGSPIINKSGEILALNFASDNTFALGVHPIYLKNALESLKINKIPSRKHIGVLTNLYSLSDAAEYRNFPQDKIKEYTKMFPQSMMNVLQVSCILQDSPAQTNLIPGDIIWAVNGKLIGPNLSTLDIAMNSEKNDFITLNICRNGEWLNINVNLYDLEDHTVKKMVQFAGAMFFESDDTFCNKTGLQAGMVTFCNSIPNSTFSKIKCYANNGGTNYLCKIISLDGQKIENLDQLIRIIPSLRSKKNFTLDYTLLCPINESKSELLGMKFSSKECYKADIEYEENNNPPRLFTFDKTTMQWTAIDIV